jgi:multidrug efflux pump subunit AcrB/outer membrane protein TolC
MKMGILEAGMRSKNIVILLTMVLMAFGVVALVKMPRDEFPQFTVRQGVIAGVYPGATSAEVEAQLTTVVENFIFGFQEVDKAKTYSLSREGMMYIFVELKGSVKNPDQFWSKLKHGLDELKMTLPAGVLALVANSDFGDTAALLITLSSETKSYKELEDQLKKLEAECRKIPNASKIKHYGLRKEKIYVNVRPEMLNEYNIKSISLLGAYQLNGMVNYAGELKDGKNNLAVHLPPNFESEKDLADQIVYSDPMGNVVRLKDIATIERRYEDPDSYIRQMGKKTVLVSIEMQPGHNIVGFGKEVDRALATFQKQCPDDIEVAKISEMPKYVNDSVGNFLKEFLTSVVSVILVIVILLPFLVASVSAFTIPVSVLITLAVSYALGLELNTVTLASLILVLGMIVDNSIVVIDNYVEKLDHGMSRWHAAIKSAKELMSPVVVATLAIMAAYVPLMIFMKGTAGEFVSTFPMVVSIALTVSVLVAAFLVPYLDYVFIRKGLKERAATRKHKTFLDVLQVSFDRSLDKAFRHPRKVIFMGVLVVLVSLLIIPTLTLQFFPEVERNQFAVEVYLPVGSSLESTAAVVDSMEHILMADRRVTNVTSFIGTSSPRFHTLYAPNMPAPNMGQIMVNTVSNKATRAIAGEYDKKYSEHFVNAHVKFKTLAMRKNRTDIEIRISSDSIRDIRSVEAQINGIINKTEHVTWVRNDWEDKQQSIAVDIDADKAGRMGYSKALVSTSLMAGLGGLPLTTIWEGDDPVPVTLTQETSQEKNMQNLEDQYITSPFTFSATPLRSFATLSPEWNEGTIVRRNGIRTLTISVDNDKDVLAQTVFGKIKKQVDKLSLPEGTSTSYGGEHETAMEEFPPVFISLMVSVVIIFFILMFAFRKARLALLIMSTMILGIPGAFIGIKLMGYPASLTGLLGITSLCGMVVRNGVILIDYARELRVRDRAMTVKQAALAAGKRRMRPIFLTSAAASVGVLPMILSRDTLWGPLGTVICFGLLVSMVLTLYMLPILYAWVMKQRPPKIRFWSLPGPKVAAVILMLIPLTAVNGHAQTTLSLDTCKALALENNYRIKEAANEVIQSAEVKKNAFTNYFPKVSAGFAAVRMNDYLYKISTPQMNLPVWDGNPMTLLNPTLFTYVPAMNFNLIDYMNIGYAMAAQPVFAGGRIYYGNKLASTGLEISRDKQAMTVSEVLMKTEELYWTVISLEKKLTTLDSYRQLLDTLHHDVSVALQAGLVQRTDLLKVQLKQNELEMNRIRLVNGIGLSKMALCQHIGMKYDSTLVLSSDVSLVSKPGTYLVDPARAAEDRNEYKMLEKAVDAGELQKKMLRGEYLPQAAVGVAGIYTDIMDKTDNNALLFATVSVPLSDWWGGSHKLKENRIKIECARQKLEETSELLVLQITQAENELAETYVQIGLAEKSLEQAGENYKVTNDNYKAGISGMSDLLEAQAACQEAKNSITEAQCNYQIKKAKYLQAVNHLK